MNIFSFSTFDMSESQARYIVEIYENLKSRYNVEVDHDFSLEIQRFGLFSSNTLNDYGPVLKIYNNNSFFYLNFIELSYITSGGRRSSSVFQEYQTWGYIELKKDYGHILIKHESYLDKIHDLINPIDIDFEDDKEFSKRFLVVAEDKLKTQVQITSTFRNLIKEIDLNEVLIEIVGNKLIIGDKKIISLESTLIFARFLSNLLKSLT